jgi:hypothetical protein
VLGGTFFVAFEVLELVEHIGAVSDLSGKAKLFLVGSSHCSIRRFLHSLDLHFNICNFK